MPTNLAPVYLDDARVQLQGDPKPRVSKIVAAGGKSADGDLVVVRLRLQGDAEGSPVQLEDVIDRAQQSEPVYLRCLPGGEKPVGGGDSDRFPQSSMENRVRPGTGATRKRPSAQGASQPQFGAARRGIAGQGAEDSPGDVPPDKQAKSDAGTGEEGSTAAQGSH